MSDILGPVTEAQEINQILLNLKKDIGEQLIYDLSSAVSPFVVSAVRRNTGRPVLVVRDHEENASSLAEEIATVLGPAAVKHFPNREILPYEIAAHSLESLVSRLEVMESLIANRGQLIVVTDIGSLESRLSPKSLWQELCLHISRGEEVDLLSFARRLTQLGYERVDMISGRGQFSVRGGILDIYPMTSDYPVRLDFFGDQVDSLRRFDVSSQRSFEDRERVDITPTSEFVYPKDRLKGALEAIERDLLEQVERLKGQGKIETAERLAESINKHLEAFREGIALQGREHFYSYFFPKEGATLLDYLPEDVVVIFDDPDRIFEASKLLEKERDDDYQDLLLSGEIIPRQMQLHVGFSELLSHMKNRQRIYLSRLGGRAPGGMRPKAAVKLMTKSIPSLAGEQTILANELKRYLENDYRVQVFISSEERSRRFSELAKSESIDITDEPAVGRVQVLAGSLAVGFEWPGNRLVVFTDRELFGTRRRPRLRSRRFDEGAELANLRELSPGDYVVHINHGIGKYAGVQTLEVTGIQRDYLAIKYRGKDRLYVPTDQLDLIQKYVGPEGKEPRLHSLSTNEWERVKNRVKKSVRSMARELLELYAERESLPGYAFSSDSAWQREFEDLFPYEETSDQLSAIADTKKDMEQPHPMDRLLCGDVGYGKTEVAMRAAFKAAVSGKQVAVLAPTTILAQQHYKTFSERFSPYPANIGLLSRFRSPKENRETIKRLKNGAVDIIIGTHRLLSKDVEFHDLGLLIIDEEHRFGVAHKERIKQLKKNIDVLAMSATPIPRTLHMSMVGIRDLSVIETPPEHRYPVQTYVAEYNENLIREAVLREVARDGQVFVVHNRVKTIDYIHRILKRLLPDVNIAVAHGQMPEAKLERVMLDFIDGQYDVLLSTTIIESGLDIPNVNTMIILDAELLGLAQLYQLRGRVGRSNRIAYAYLMYRGDRILNEQAQKRLKAIKEFTELSSGFKIALRDLEIRGAGNILGPEQHGFVADVGFDLYCQLLENAVAELKGKKPKQEKEAWRPEISINVDAYIPSSYIEDARQRIEIYRELAAITGEKEVLKVKAELRDRFGRIPDPVSCLLEIARIKVLMYNLNIGSLEERDGYLHLIPRQARQFPWDKVNILDREHRKHVFIKSGRDRTLAVKKEPDNVRRTLDRVYNILTFLTKIEGGTTVAN